MDTVMEREVLEAFVDGGLSPEESARVVLHLADCPNDANYVDALMELNALLGSAYAEPLNQAIPERIRAAIFPAAAVAPARSAGRTGWRAARPATRRIAAWAAVGAAAALVVGVAVDPRPENPVQIAGEQAADAALRVALEDSLSGAVPTTGDERITLIATYRDRTGRPCREYEILHDIPHDNAQAQTRGIACRSAGDGWETEIAVASRLPGSANAGRDYYGVAGGAQRRPEPGALKAALDQLGVGMILTPAEERALVESDWAK